MEKEKEGKDNDKLNCKVKKRKERKENGKRASSCKNHIYEFMLFKIKIEQIFR